MATKIRRKTTETRELILEAATELFHTEGYSASSLEVVAAKAGVTKPTVYSHFQSKKGLFESVVARAAEQRLGLLQDAVSFDGDPRTDLTRFGEFFLSLALDPDTQRWDRLAAAECMKHPEVGELFFNAGPAKLLRRLTEAMRKYTKQGCLKIAKPSEAAEQLIGLLIGVDMLRSQIGLKTLSPRQQKQRAKEAVSVFLAAYEGGQR